jgi:hypothetical protein
MGVARGVRKLVDGGFEVTGWFLKLAAWMFVAGLVLGLVVGVRAGLAWDGDLAAFETVVGGR